MVSVVNTHTHLHTHVHTHTQERTDAFGRDGSVYALTGARVCLKSSNRAHYIRVVSHVSVIPQRPWTKEGLTRENRTSIVRIKTVDEDTSREKRGKAVCPSVPRTPGWGFRALGWDTYLRSGGRRRTRLPQRAGGCDGFTHRGLRELCQGPRRGLRGREAAWAKCPRRAAWPEMPRLGSGCSSAAGALAGRPKRFSNTLPLSDACRSGPHLSPILKTP